MRKSSISISRDGRFTFKAAVGRKLFPIDCQVVGDKINLSFGFNKQLLADVKNLDGASWEPIDRHWTIKASLRNFFAIDCMTLQKPLLRNFFDPLKEVYPPIEMWRHQTEIFQKILTYQFQIIAAEMRTGKTLPTLKAIEAVPSVENKDDVWWVAPKSAINGLERELVKWNYSKDLNLMTYDKFRNIVHSELFGSIPKFIVFDEAQKLKTPTSQQSKAAAIIRDLQFSEYGHGCYRVLLSGTPAPKDPTDWWHLCEVAMPGYIKEPTKEKLKHSLAYQELDDTTAAHSFWKFKGWNEEEVNRLYKRMRGLVSTYLKKDCLDLPEIMYEEVYLQPSKELLAVAESVVATSNTVLESIILLRQLSDGFRYVNEYNDEKNKMERVETEFFGSPKEDQLRKDLDELEDVGRAVIYGGFSGTVDVITKICIEKKWCVLRIDGRGYQVFNPDKSLADEDGVPITVDKNLCLNEIDGSTNKYILPKLAIVAQADAASTGLEFSAAPVSIYYSNTNNGAARMQSEARPHSDNMDKNRGYLVKDYIHLPSDKKILDSLKNKKHLQSISMGEMQEIFEAGNTIDSLIKTNRS